MAAVSSAVVSANARTLAMNAACIRAKLGPTTCFLPTCSSRHTGKLRTVRDCERVEHACFLLTCVRCACVCASCVERVSCVACDHCQSLPSSPRPPRIGHGDPSEHAICSLQARVRAACELPRPRPAEPGSGAAGKKLWLAGVRSGCGSTAACVRSQDRLPGLPRGPLPWRPLLGGLGSNDEAAGRSLHARRGPGCLGCLGERSDLCLGDDAAGAGLDGVAGILGTHSCSQRQLQDEDWRGRLEPVLSEHIPMAYSSYGGLLLLGDAEHFQRKTENIGEGKGLESWKCPRDVVDQSVIRDVLVGRLLNEESTKSDELLRAERQRSERQRRGLACALVVAGS